MSDNVDEDVPQKGWIESLLESLEMVQWDRFVRAEDDRLGVYYDIYGWIDRDEDAYKDFILLRVFPETDENLRMFTTSSDYYHDEINEILFGDTSESNHCQRVEHTFEVPNVVKIDEPELATDGGRVEDADGTDRIHGPHRVPRIECGKCGHEHHIDAATGEYQGRCAECYAFLRRPTEAEQRAFYRFMDWKARWTEHQRGDAHVA